MEHNSKMVATSNQKLTCITSIEGIVNMWLVAIAVISFKTETIRLRVSTATLW